ncbi:hypothetical protein NE237_017656 [Protea cynaroides]|uniref:Uncharacterized protein n=1 Tax=Protea cynaroides TaxID=273540 RepID=A0A9Q0K8G0_9MAGN|nr:hypothetical protein NE237_017656 [Protea cynaroides]
MRSAMSSNNEEIYKTELCNSRRIACTSRWNLHLQLSLGSLPAPPVNFVARYLQLEAPRQQQLQSELQAPSFSHLQSININDVGENVEEEEEMTQPHGLNSASPESHGPSGREMTRPSHPKSFPWVSTITTEKWSTTNGARSTGCSSKTDMT